MDWFAAAYSRGIYFRASRSYPRAVNSLTIQVLLTAFAASKAVRQRIESALAVGRVVGVTEVACADGAFDVYSVKGLHGT